MAFGPIMQLRVGELEIELAPLSKDVMKDFISPGMQRASITRYLAHNNGFVLEDEEEWYEKTRTEKDSLVWGIYVREGERRKLIGNTALFKITREHIHQATSGSMIFDSDYWGKGIASAIHRARTWFAFQHLGLHRIMSAVIQGNVGSLKALQKSGYEVVYVERNVAFVDGRLKNHDCLACLNPREPFWGQWWHGDRPTKRETDARKRTAESLMWAEANVTLL